MFTSSADGTEANPIIIRSENPEKPAILSGSSTSENYVLDISGDWWKIKDLKVTNAQKGIILDNSNHTEIINCEVYNIGSEGFISEITVLIVLRKIVMFMIQVLYLPDMVKLFTSAVPKALQVMVMIVITIQSETVNLVRMLLLNTLT